MFECIEKRLNHGRNCRGELVFSTYKTKQVKSKSIINAKEKKNLYKKKYENRLQCLVLNNLHFT